MKKYPSIRYPNEPEADGLLEHGEDIVVMEKLSNSPLGNYESVQMEMMKDLPRVVLTDVMEENGWELLNNDFECEFDSDFKGEVRSKTSKKCARVLKEEVQSL